MSRMKSFCFCNTLCNILNFMKREIKFICCSIMWSNVHRKQNMMNRVFTVTEQMHYNLKFGNNKITFCETKQRKLWNENVQFIYFTTLFANVFQITNHLGLAIIFEHFRILFLTLITFQIELETMSKFSINFNVLMTMNVKSIHPFFDAPLGKRHWLQVNSKLAKSFSILQVSFWSELFSYLREFHISI